MKRGVLAPTFSNQVQGSIDLIMILLISFLHNRFGFWFCHFCSLVVCEFLLCLLFLLFLLLLLFCCCCCCFLLLSLQFFHLIYFVSLMQVHPRDCFVYLVSCAITLVMSVVVAVVVAVVSRWCSVCAGVLSTYSCTSIRLEFHYINMIYILV